MPNLVARVDCVEGVRERGKKGEDWQRELGTLPRGAHPLGITHSQGPGSGLPPPLHQQRVTQLSLLTSLMIFKAPVGEKKKRLMLSLNLGGTLARPSAPFGWPPSLLG